MKNNKNLNPIGQLFKTQLNTPKTETRIILETEDLYPDLAVKKSKLSSAARQKIVNRNKPYQSQDQEGYGPCSYSGCPYPNLPFSLEIKIEGNSRSWGRHYDCNSFPGYWQYSPNMFGDYCWRRELWLNRTDQGRHAISLMNINNLWTVNAAGLFCAENDRFCRSAERVINGYIEAHESGDAIQKCETIDSNWSKWSRYGFKAGAAIGASFINPGAAIAIGAGAFGAGQIGQAVCDSDRGKSFWGTISDMGISSLGL